VFRTDHRVAGPGDEGGPRQAGRHGREPAKIAVEWAPGRARGKADG
jgi:hypothetical protein